MTIDEQLRTVEGVARTALDWFSIILDNDTAVVLCEFWNKRTGVYNTAAGPLIWLKNRLLERQLFDSGGQQENDEFTTADLHVAFLFIEETEEMLCRLRNEPKTTSSVARSKIGKTASVIQPIDGLAATVANWEN